VHLVDRLLSGIATLETIPPHVVRVFNYPPSDISEKKMSPIENSSAEVPVLRYRNI
jgi:hypothetical protein